MHLFEWLRCNKETLQIINSFAPWFAAMGTIFAGSVALYFGLRRDRIRIEATALHKVLLSGAMRKDYLEIRVVNAGFTRANITGVDLQWGRHKKKHAVFGQEFEKMISSSLPIEIEPGQECKYYYPWEQWLSAFKAAQDGETPLDPHTIKIREGLRGRCLLVN